MSAILQHWNNQREIKHKSKKSIGNQMSRGGKRNGPGRKPGSKAPRLSPAAPQIKQELRERARKHTGTALETLVKICTSGESETARVSAASALLDRGYGKPGRQVNLDITHYDRRTGTSCASGSPSNFTPSSC